MDIILFGMQGSGKGTQGRILAKKYDLLMFEMGAELRKMIESESSLGQKIKDTVESGNLVNDDTVMEVVDEFIRSVEPTQSILFDGIPRTMQQSEKLMERITSNDREAFGLLIKISEEEAMKRLTQRRICKKCKAVFPAFYHSDECSECGGELVVRQDDNTASIEKRIENFKKETQPVIDEFYSVDRLIQVDGEQDIDVVADEMIDKAGYLFN